MDQTQQLQDDEYSFPYHYVSQFRNGFTQTFFDSWGINYVSTIEFLISKLASEKFSHAVDIGCGDGRLTAEIQRSFADRKITGIDYSTKAISLARCMNPRGDYQALDIIHELPEKRFDLGILMEVFEHIDPNIADTFVRSIKKILSEKAVLYVTVPHANKPVEYKHYRHFTVASLTACFAPHFTPVEVVPFEKGKTRKGIIDFWLGNRFFILNSGNIRTALYNYYKKNLFIAEERNCNRILVKFVRND